MIAVRETLKCILNAVAHTAVRIMLPSIIRQAAEAAAQTKFDRRFVDGHDLLRERLEKAWDEAKPRMNARARDMPAKLGFGFNCELAPLIPTEKEVETALRTLPDFRNVWFNVDVARMPVSRDPEKTDPWRVWIDYGGARDEAFARLLAKAPTQKKEAKQRPSYDPKKARDELRRLENKEDAVPVAIGKPVPAPEGEDIPIPGCVIA